eukprot:TRINITY_DN100_c2_g1_i1.p1 TRINITY_DN100_c2_g1~~TRINITY_DN100_c2_g1_i1.p1  ORF type:complete len:273 (+),score=-47.15 TRINITY_DN100_c2_g1_i1:1513-2331(+)
MHIKIIEQVSLGYFAMRFTIDIVYFTFNFCQFSTFSQFTEISRLCLSNCCPIFIFCSLRSICISLTSFFMTSISCNKVTFALINSSFSLPIAVYYCLRVVITFKFSVADSMECCSCMCIFNFHQISLYYYSAVRKSPYAINRFLFATLQSHPSSYRCQIINSQCPHQFYPILWKQKLFGFAVTLFFPRVLQCGCIQLYIALHCIVFFSFFTVRQTSFMFCTTWFLSLYENTWLSAYIVFIDTFRRFKLADSFFHCFLKCLFNISKKKSCDRR